MRRESVDYGKEVLAVLFLAAGIFVTLCLLSYHPADPAFNSVSNVSTIRNFGGVVGSYAADILLIIFGISAYVVAGILLLMGFLQLVGKGLRLRFREIVFYFALLIFASSLIHVFFETINIRGHEVAGGGMIGGLFGQMAIDYFNRAGAILFLSAASLLVFTLATHITLVMIGDGLYHIFGRISGVVKFALKWFFGMTIRGLLVLSDFVVRVFHDLPASFNTIYSIAKRLASRSEKLVEKSVIKAKPSSSKDDIIAIEPIAKKNAEGALSKESEAGPKILSRADLKQKRRSEEQLKFMHVSYDGYAPPSLSLLDPPKEKKIEIDEKVLKKQSFLLEKKLADFSVSGKVTAIHPGPVITMYEFEPAIGTKINQITNLEDDLSLALGGRSVRVLAHLPGKAAVGIEVPNGEREIVYLREIISSVPFEKSNSKLVLALGASTDGHPMVTDLAKMPHLLVAGATGSGKSVAIHSMIASLLYKASPEEIKFILVDPKMLELSAYNGIPHLLLPVVTQPKKAILAMKWAVREMERRYKLLSASGARNIIGYNNKIKSGEIKLVEREKAEEMLLKDKEAIVHTGALPYIIIIIDEMADLMMTVSSEMEETITRLAQMARASGIHLILATQRPSVDVITGLIKANFPARIAFKTTARHDSRTILDSMGAETLLGSGDMLFMSPSGGILTRVHGSYVSEGEVSRIVSHLKQQGEPVYDESIVESAKGSDESEEEFDDIDDEVYDKAVAMVVETKQASISMIQRRMRIGYNRAARLIERMEAQGVVGPADGSKPREVLVGDANGHN